MILYNITLNVEDAVCAEWITWMKTIHIPQVMESKCFQSFKMFRLIDRQSDESGQTYAVQYFAHNMEDYLRYRADFAPALQAETLSRWGNQVLAFRTLLEEV